MGMEVYIDQAVDWILTLSPASIYSIFFLVAYAENIVPPVPGDVLIVFGGYLAAEQIIGFNVLLFLTTVASVIGFMNMYAFGYYFGDKIDTHRSDFWLMRIIDVKYFDRCKRWMHSYGQAVIVTNRFLAGTRSVIAVTAGLQDASSNNCVKFIFELNYMEFCVIGIRVARARKLVCYRRLSKHLWVEHPYTYGSDYWGTYCVHKVFERQYERNLKRNKKMISF